LNLTEFGRKEHYFISCVDYDAYSTTMRPQVRITSIAIRISFLGSVKEDRYELNYGKIY